jgi:hypothetical protein
MSRLLVFNSALEERRIPLKGFYAHPAGYDEKFSHRISGHTYFILSFQIGEFERLKF